ncbi:helix-turn-helix transcriptional regulator [Terasakiella sp. A23]|uniref:helix-turn-helix domain-containing protein n=1 Tax=Terasakiella sp. FCG-A23 TaxID=3080561 RepID=UPI0029550C14|nr:helix-turn-helix transcriptional regulator [Terasakiella sp. A23]MDV7341261.1 helix-turn-helix transcriptional regulator [Terasakiella sp. A23]
MTQLNKVHFSSISDFMESMGLARPEHPMLAVCEKKNITSTGDVSACSSPGICYSTDFYAIAIKEIVSGEFHYGRTKYDFTNGSMMFMAPRQEVSYSNLVVTKEAIMIFIHEDFVKGHELHNTLKKYSFFSYAANEALHLSPKEEKLMRQLMQNIHEEYQNNQDEFSKELLLSQLDTLLKYANRYYKRQFLNRTDMSSEIVTRFNDAIRSYFEEGKMDLMGVPKIEDIADELKMSARYLSDMLKAETGKNAIEHIHLYLLDEAKNLLLQPDKTVAEVAYQLGFDYPQYFSRLFKKKIGQSPKEYREQNSLH